eukprot:UN06783
MQNKRHRQFHTRDRRYITSKNLNILPRGYNDREINLRSKEL